MLAALPESKGGRGVLCADVAGWRNEEVELEFVHLTDSVEMKAKAK